MLKYLNTEVTFQEIPDEITLCINITGCKLKCKNCHSAYLAEDIGVLLSEAGLTVLIEVSKGISCVAFMGGDINPEEINLYAAFIKDMFPSIKVAWYSGRQELSKDIDLKNFDFIKLGPYIEELGGLKSPTTNQRLYEVKMCKELDEKGNPIYGLEDITEVFWK